MSRYNIAQRLELANDIINGHIPEWLLAGWDKLYQQDSKTTTREDAQKLICVRKLRYRLGRGLLYGFIGTIFLWVFMALLWGILGTQKSPDVRYVIFFSSAGFLFGNIFFSNWDNDPWLLSDQWYSWRRVKNHMKDLPPVKNTAQHLANEQIIALAVIVLRGQARLTVDSSDPAERGQQVRAVEQQLGEEAKRIEKLSQAFNLFKMFDLVTLDKSGGYGWHFSEAKKRLATESNSET